MGIKPIFVFDGAPPAIKGDTQRRRRERRADAEKDKVAAKKSLLTNVLKLHALKTLTDEVVNQKDIEKIMKKLAAAADETPEDFGFVSSDLKKIDLVSSSDDESEEESSQEPDDIQLAVRDHLLTEFVRTSELHTDSDVFRDFSYSDQLGILSEIRDSFKFDRSHLTGHLQPAGTSKTCDENDLKFSDYQLQGVISRSKIFKKIREIEDERKSNRLRDIFEAPIPGKLRKTGRKYALFETESAEATVTEKRARTVFDVLEEENERRNSEIDRFSSSSSDDEFVTDDSDYEENQMPSTSANNNILGLGSSILPQSSKTLDFDEIKIPEAILARLIRANSVLSSDPTSEQLHKCNLNKGQGISKFVFDEDVSLSEEDIQSTGHENNIYPAVKDKLKYDIILHERDASSNISIEETTQATCEINTNPSEGVAENDIFKEEILLDREGFEERPDNLHEALPGEDIPGEVVEDIKQESLQDTVKEECGPKYSSKNISVEFPNEASANFGHSEEFKPKTVQDESEKSVSVNDRKKNFLRSDESVENFTTMSVLAENAKQLEKLASADRLATAPSQQLYRDAAELLSLFGCGVFFAPGEAEAQCAEFEMANITQGTITDDGDTFLFGGRIVIKGLTLGRMVPLKYDIEKTEYSRDFLIALAQLTGSDYCQGIKSVGSKTALKILEEFDDRRPKTTPDGILSIFANWWRLHNKSLTTGTNGIPLRCKLKKLNIEDDFPSNRVTHAYLHPNVEKVENKTIRFTVPNLERIRNFAIRRLDWDEAKVDEHIIPLLPEKAEKRKDIRFYMNQN